MSRFRFTRLTRLAVLLVAIGVTPLTHAQETIRAELGKPLQQAQDMMRAQRYKEALAKVRDADRIGAKNPAEQLTLDRMRGAAAQGAGDNATAAKSYEAAINSGKMPAGDNVKLMQALAILYYRAQDYAKSQVWIQRYIKEGGTDSQVRGLLAQTYFLNNDFAKAQKELQTTIAADEKAGRTPAEETYQLLVSTALKQNDSAAYVQAMEKLVRAYPKKQYWAELVNRLASKKGFSDRFALDVFRLRLAGGLLKTAGDYMEMSQLALQAGYAAEGKKIADMGFKAGILGLGAEAPRQKRLLDLANRNAVAETAGFAAAEAAALASKDGTDMVNVGFALVAAGQADKGLALIEGGIKKGNLKSLDDARLHLGVAYASAGKKDLAAKAFKSVKGTDGAADLAGLWLVQTTTPMN
jgi:hypothetical protein